MNTLRRVAQLGALLLSMSCRQSEQPRTAAEIATCSPLIWLLDNHAVLELPAAGGVLLNGARIDSAAVPRILHAIYEPRQPNRRLLEVIVVPTRRHESAEWWLGTLDTLQVVVTQRQPDSMGLDSATGLEFRIIPRAHSPRAATAADSFRRGQLPAAKAAATVADELLAHCVRLDGIDEPPELHQATQAELRRRAGWS